MNWHTRSFARLKHTLTHAQRAQNTTGEWGYTERPTHHRRTRLAWELSGNWPRTPWILTACLGPLPTRTDTHVRDGVAWKRRFRVWPRAQTLPPWHTHHTRTHTHTGPPISIHNARMKLSWKRAGYWPRATRCLYSCRSAPLRRPSFCASPAVPLSSCGYKQEQRSAIPRRHEQTREAGHRATASATSLVCLLWLSWDRTGQDRWDSWPEIPYTKKIYIKIPKGPTVPGQHQLPTHGGMGTGQDKWGRTPSWRWHIFWKNFGGHH